MSDDSLTHKVIEEGVVDIAPKNQYFFAWAKILVTYSLPHTWRAEVFEAQNFELGFAPFEIIGVSAFTAESDLSKKMDFSMRLVLSVSDETKSIMTNFHTDWHLAMQRTRSGEPAGVAVVRARPDAGEIEVLCASLPAEDFEIQILGSKAF